MQDEIDGAGYKSATPWSNPIVAKYPPSLIDVPKRGVYCHSREKIHQCRVNWGKKSAKTLITRITMKIEMLGMSM